MRVQVGIRQDTFRSFKNLVDQAFPAWKVNDFAPVVYVTHNGKFIAHLFTMQDYQFSQQELDTLQKLAVQAMPVVAERSNFCPVVNTKPVGKNTAKKEANKLRLRQK